MVRGLPAVFSAVWHLGTILSDWKKGVRRPYLERERRPSRLQQLLRDNAAQRTRQGARPPVIDAISQVLGEISET